MSDFAIDVAALGKQYRIGVRAERYFTLRDSLARLGTRARAVLRGNGTADAQPSLFWALRDVSFRVRRGEVVGIIGRNGAGKTTLLKILSRITEPTAGRAEITGRVSALLEVGTGFHPELTGRENVYLNGAILGMRTAEITRKFDDIVNFAEVEKFIDTPVKHYSSGMHVRLAFAVAAHLEREVLLVDEVLAVGDFGFQKKCLGKMDEIGREGRTVFIVSHSMPSILNLCERAILLENGGVVADGPAVDVVQRYLATSRSVGGEVVWADPATAPGSHAVRLHAARIVQDDGLGSTADVDIARDVYVDVEYWVTQEGAPIFVSLWLRDRVGTDVLASGNARSMSLTDDGWSGRPHPRGLYRSRCRIPGNFLNDGRYSVTVILGKLPSMEPVVLEEDVLVFDVTDTGVMRKEWYGGWIGTVRPRLAWYTEPRGRQG